MLELNVGRHHPFYDNSLKGEVAGSKVILEKRKMLFQELFKKSDIKKF